MHYILDDEQLREAVALYVPLPKRKDALQTLRRGDSIPVAVCGLLRFLNADGSITDKKQGSSLETDRDLRKLLRAERA